MVLGMRQLKRWVMLALFAHTDSRGIDSPLLELAVNRGRLMELLTMRLCSGNAERELAESAFMTGMFSLADTLFEIPMAKLVEQINLADEVKDALLRRQGTLGTILQLAERLEENDFVAAAPLLEQMSLTVECLASAQFETINWVAELRDSGGQP
jgi:EAL and modified HD-GYP domain-containing signal transduction protein